MADLTFLIEFTKGDKQKLSRYVSAYLKQAPGVFFDMKENIDSRQWDRLKVNAHSLKPQADYMGVPDLRIVLEEIENAIDTEDHHQIPDAYSRALDLHVEAEKSLRTFLDGLQSENV